MRIGVDLNFEIWRESLMLAAHKVMSGSIELGTRPREVLQIGKQELTQTSCIFNAGGLVLNGRITATA